MMSLIRKIGIGIGIAMGTVACMTVTIVGTAFGSDKIRYMAKRRTEKRYAATRLKQAGEARDEAETG